MSLLNIAYLTFFKVILYSLMSSARRCDQDAGFLIYLKTGSLHPVVGNHMDRRGWFVLVFFMYSSPKK